jgi:hypothetical protein
MTQPPPRDSNRSSKVGLHSRRSFITGNPALQWNSFGLEWLFSGFFGSLLQERSGRPLADRCEMIPDRLLGPHGIARLDRVEDGLMQGTASDPETFH